MSIIIDGTAGLTYPNSTVQASAGVVLQVVNAVSGTATNTSSTSYVVTTLTASITPKFSTSKIYVVANYEAYTTTAGTKALTTIYRNGATNLAGSSDVMGVLWTSSGGQLQATNCITVLDSPATTSSTTYAVYLKASAANSVGVNNDGYLASITLMEIAG